MEKQLVQILNPYYAGSGRLVGKSSDGVQYIMPQKAAQAVFGDEKLPEAIFAIVGKVQRVDKDNNAIVRDEILAAFKGKAAAIEAWNSGRLLAVEAESAFKQAAKAAGLEEADLKALASVNI